MSVAGNFYFIFILFYFYVLRMSHVNLCVLYIICYGMFKCCKNQNSTVLHALVVRFDEIYPQIYKF